MKGLRILVVVFFFISLLPTGANNNFTAYAGHSIANGAWCQCGCTACICDPGETPGACTNSVAPNPDTKAKSGSVDLQGIGFLLLVLSLLGYRMRL